MYIKQNSEWNYYQEYNKVRSELLDYGLPDYNENEQHLNELGITKNDYTMISNWTFADPERLGLNTLKAIAELKKPNPLTLGKVKEFVINFAASHLCNMLFDFSLIAGIVYILVANKRKWFVLVFIELTACAELFYLFLQNREVDRVLTGIYMCMACFTLYLFDKSNFETILKKLPSLKNCF